MGAVIDKRAFEKISDYIDDAQQNATIVAGRRREGRRGLLHRADADRDGRSRLPAAVRGDLRPGRHGVRLRRCEVERDARDRRRDVAVRADRRGVLARIARAVRRRAIALRNAAGNFYINDKPTGAVVGQQPFGGARGIGHERQGGLEAQSRALGERADDQGDVLSAARLQISVHVGGILGRPEGRPLRLSTTRAEDGRDLRCIP